MAVEGTVITINVMKSTTYGFQTFVFIPTDGCCYQIWSWEKLHFWTGAVVTIKTITSQTPESK